MYQYRRMKWACIERFLCFSLLSLSGKCSLSSLFSFCLSVCLSLLFSLSTLEMTAIIIGEIGLENVIDRTSSICRVYSYCEYMQEFLKVFKELRDELVHDDLLDGLDGQPEASKQWVQEVGTFGSLF